MLFRSERIYEQRVKDLSPNIATLGEAGVAASGTSRSDLGE